MEAGAISVLEARQEQEMEELEERIKEMLKSSKKSTRVAIETETLRMKYELKAKHQEESDELEDQIKNGIPVTITPLEPGHEKETVTPEPIDPSIAKREKSQKKKEKKAEKEAQKSIQRDVQKQQIQANAGPNLRALELSNINHQLNSDRLVVKEILSDGNCLYRAISDQLQFTSTMTSISNPNPLDHNAIRKLAADFMRAHPEDFLPFLDLEHSPRQGGAGASRLSAAPAVLSPEEAFENYCSHVEDPVKAIWGGHLELQALARALQREIRVYEQGPDSPMRFFASESEPSPSATPLRITFHRHYYGLGEHYNSVCEMDQAKK